MVYNFESLKMKWIAHVIKLNPERGGVFIKGGAGEVVA
jgi:hypothetical protein